ncbi:MAG TPA: LysE family transporter [Candidatus Dormibacteraeota bacterium]|nr:LysE family transporter [Candidatus Dormibacteraeota bacterium]
MGAELALKGAVLGFSIAAPVGPIGILCIRRTLAHGRGIGFASGLGAASADAAYGAVAAYGLTFISSFLGRQEFWLGLVGGIFLCWMGVRSFLAKPAEGAAPAGRAGWLAAYLSTLFLTLTNPATIFSFMALFAGFGLGKTRDYLGASAMVAGVFLGSALWWLILSGGVGWARARFTVGWMRWVNRGSGILLLSFGVFALLRLDRHAL